MGVMYTLGAQPNTTLAFNYIRDAARVWAGVGFHHDEGSSGILDHANVVYNAPALAKIHVTYKVRARPASHLFLLVPLSPTTFRAHMRVPSSLLSPVLAPAPAMCHRLFSLPPWVPPLWLPAQDHNMSDPLTRDIAVTDCWTNTHPVGDSASGPPGLITFKGNLYINTTAGQDWPAAAVRVMQQAGVIRPAQVRAAATHLSGPF